jgi:hypothetical protein
MFYMLTVFFSVLVPRDLENIKKANVHLRVRNIDALTSRLRKKRKERQRKRVEARHPFQITQLEAAEHFLFLNVLNDFTDPAYIVRFKSFKVCILQDVCYDVNRTLTNDAMFTQSRN